jgi:tyrosyl-tRNA synthetase
MFAKIMSIPDDLMREYFVLLTDVPEEEVERLLAGHPKEAKKRLADEIVAGYHPGHRAREHWERLFEKRDVPEEIAELCCEAEIGALDLVSRTGLFPSRSEARRVIEQGGVELDGTRICDPRAVLSLRTGQILRVGKKRRFFRITVR